MDNFVQEPVVDIGVTDSKKILHRNYIRGMTTYNDEDKIYELLSDDNLTFLGNMKSLLFIITKSGCTQCTILKETLVSKNLNYIEIPYELLTKQSLKNIYEMRKKSEIKSLTFPILLIGMENYFLF